MVVEEVYGLFNVIVEMALGVGRSVRGAYILWGQRAWSEKRRKSFIIQIIFSCE